MWCILVCGSKVRAWLSAGGIAMGKTIDAVRHRQSRATVSQLRLGRRLLGLCGLTGDGNDYARQLLAYVCKRKPRGFSKRVPAPSFTTEPGGAWERRRTPTVVPRATVQTWMTANLVRRSREQRSRRNGEFNRREHSFLTCVQKMPPADPGQMSGQAYADLEAYILQANGLEPGTTELTAAELGGTSRAERTSSPARFSGRRTPEYSRQS